MYGAHAFTAPRAASLNVTARALRAWQAGTRTPSRKDLAAIEQAYRTVRRENVARYLLARSTARAAAPAWKSAPSTSPASTGPPTRSGTTHLNVRR